MLVRDPLFYRWSYFPREQRGTWPGFSVRLRESLWWGGCKGGPEIAKTYEPPPQGSLPGRTTRLAVQPFPAEPEEGAWCRQVVAYAWLDTYFIRTGQLRLGEVPAEQAFGGLDAWSPASTPASVLPPDDPCPPWGEATCLLAEVADDVDLARLAELAERCYASFFGADKPTVGLASGGARLPFGFMAVIPGEHRDDAVLLYSASRTAVVKTVPDFAMHRWFLSTIKARHCVARYGMTPSPEGERHEEVIRGTLAQAAAQGLSLRRLESLSSTLSQQSLDLGDRIRAMEDDLQAMHVAVRNTTHLIDDAALWDGATRSQLAPLLLDPVARHTEQMELIVKHSRLLNESARSTQEHVAAVAELRRGMWERWIALILFGTVILEVFHAFHEDLPSPLYIRVLIALAAYFVLLTLAWGLDYLSRYILRPQNGLPDRRHVD